MEGAAMKMSWTSRFAVFLAACLPVFPAAAADI